jgi:hypothetical protein
MPLHHPTPLDTSTQYGKAAVPVKGVDPGPPSPLLGKHH